VCEEGKDEEERKKEREAQQNEGVWSSPDYLGSRSTMRAVVQRVLSARVEASCVFTEDDRSHVEIDMYKRIYHILVFEC
jgi:hypothetical protein